MPDVPTEETEFGSTDFGTSEDDDTFGKESSDETSFSSGDSSDSLNFVSTDLGSTDFNSDDTNSDDPFATEESPDTDEDSSPFDFGSEEPSDTDEKVEMAPASEDEEKEFEEPEYEPTPIIQKSPEPNYKTPENFDDLRKFAESTSISGMGAEGNPSFSVLLKNIRYIEDVNDILALMKELSLLSDPEEQIRQRLMRGHLLVPRISEYAAIYLAHKLRRFDIDIQVGLSDEIHPPKHQESPETGLVSKYSLYQNQTHHFHFDDPKLEISQIIVAASPNLEGHQVLKYLGVASEHKILDGHIVEDENSEEIPRYYSELAQKLKAHALKSNANAVIGLNYQLTPLPSDYGSTGSKYRLSCTGNLVWVNKL